MDRDAEPGLPALGHPELLRYARHLALPGVGETGQRRLKAARVLVVGAGGLGSPAALYLAAAGVGTLGLAEFDAVDVSNLQRQILHGTAHVGRSKLASAQARLADLNPHVTVQAIAERLTADNALGHLRRFDIIVDGSDNFPTRYLLNDGCVLLGKPLVYGAIFRFDGQAAVFDARRGPCYRCLFGEPPPPELVPSCAEGGVLGALPGIIGSMQALEALKLVLGIGTPLIGRLVLVDGLTLSIRELTVRKDPDCAVCGERPTVRELIDYEAFCGVSATETPTAAEISVPELRTLLQSGSDGVQLLDVREPFEWEIARLPGAAHVPLGSLPERLAELDGHREIVAYCHHGVRSLRARAVLRAAGFARVRSLHGGIDAWAREVDPEMARY